jgi:hypothetical protein
LTFVVSDGLDFYAQEAHLPAREKEKEKEEKRERKTTAVQIVSTKMNRRMFPLKTSLRPTSSHHDRQKQLKRVQMLSNHCTEVQELEV